MNTFLRALVTPWGTGWDPTGRQRVVKEWERVFSEVPVQNGEALPLSCLTQETSLGSLSS